MKANFLLLLVLVMVPVFINAQQDDFALIKSRVVAELMRTTVDDESAEKILTRIDNEGKFVDINYDDLSRTAGFPHRQHTYNLVHLAKSYKNKTSKFYRDEALKKKIETSLKYWIDHDFFGDNWHNNQISTPTNLVNLMLVMGEEFPDDLVSGAQPIIGRAHMEASGARPSGDRIVIAGILAKNLLFLNDRESFDKIIRLIEGEVKFSTGKRGMQHDYSFHHRVDRVNNTTSYGYGKYANAFGEWSYYVAGTKYAFSIERINHLVDYYLDGIYKQMVYGVYTDISVKNRSISHKAEFKPHGTREIERLLHSTDYRKEELEEIMQLRKGDKKPTESFCKFFWQTEHFVCQRPGYYTTVRMYSTRNRNMEQPYNGPGITTHHRADGTNYLMLKGDEYHNIWPVYDWQKISGTTIMQKSELHGSDQIQLNGLTDFVGAVTDELYGAVAFDFISAHDRVAAKKSWFFFDEEYICLGAGIKSLPRLPVFTTINQTLMQTEVSLQQNEKISEVPSGRHELKDIKWVHHDDIGYIFPDPKTINLSNQIETGRWSDITDQKNISDDVISKEVFSLWFDHGLRPNDGSYEYIVVPGVSRDDLKHTAEHNRHVEILSNTEKLQAVLHRKLQLSQLIFYSAGEINVVEDLNVKLESQGMIMLEMDGERIKKITVSDPSRKLSKMILTVSGDYHCQADHCTMVPSEDGGSSTFIISLPEDVYAGKSISIKLES